MCTIVVHTGGAVVLLLRGALEISEGCTKITVPGLIYLGGTCVFVCVWIDFAVCVLYVC